MTATAYSHSAKKSHLQPPTSVSGRGEVALSGWCRLNVPGVSWRAWMLSKGVAEMELAAMKAVMKRLVRRIVSLYFRSSNYSPFE